jgi:hypothetical protein
MDRIMRAALLITTALAVMPYAWASDPRPRDREDGPLAAGRRRQEVVVRLNADLQITQTFPKGWVSTRIPNSRDVPDVSPADVTPSSDTTVHSVNRVTLDGASIRYESNLPSWQTSDGALLRPKRISVFDGSFTLTYYPRGITGHDVPTGIRDKSVSPRAFRMSDLTPILMTFRGVDPRLATCPLSRLKPTGIKLPIDGAVCEEFVAEDDEETRSWWFDATKSYVLRRLSERRPMGQLFEQCDIQYQHDASGSWVPAGWTCTLPSRSGATGATMSVVVAKLELNPNVDKEALAVTFPAGCLVFDNADHKRYYIAADGRTQLADRSAARPPVDEFEEPAPWRPRWYHAVIIAAAVAATIRGVVRRGLMRRTGLGATGTPARASRGRRPRGPETGSLQE